MMMIKKKRRHPQNVPKNAEPSLCRDGENGNKNKRRKKKDAWVLHPQHIRLLLQSTRVNRGCAAPSFPLRQLLRAAACSLAWWVARRDEMLVGSTQGSGGGSVTLPIPPTHLCVCLPHIGPLLGLGWFFFGFFFTS